MYSLIVLAVVSLLASLIITPSLRGLFTRWGVVDAPDGKRKIHDKPVARMGGVPILVSYLLAYGVLLLTPMGGVGVVRLALPVVWRLWPAVAVVFAVGLVDDIWGLKPWQKLLGESAACGLAILGGVHLTGVAGVQFPTALALIGTVVWLIGCTNAVNLIDGMDGLAAGIALLATCTTFVAALLQGYTTLAFATIPLAGALLGFLRYNIAPASIFLGDSGSLTLGFMLGCYSILWSAKAATLVGMTAPLLMLAVPLVDAALAIVRRFLRQQPIFAADRGHIHHRLLARGLTPRRAVLLLYAVAGVCAWLSLGVGLLHRNYTEPILFVFVLGTLIAISFLKYAEFGTARRMVLEGAFRRLLNARISLDAVKGALEAAGSVEECWRQLVLAYPDFGFTSVELRAEGRTFLDTADSAGRETGRLPGDVLGQVEAGAGNGNGASADRAGQHGGWKVIVELENGNYIVLRRASRMHHHITLAATFAEMLEQTLTVKLEEFQTRASGEKGRAAMAAGA